MITKDHHLDPLVVYRLSRLLVIHRNSIHRQLKKISSRLKFSSELFSKNFLIFENENQKRFEITKNT